MSRADRSDGRSLRSGFFLHATERPDAVATVVRGQECSYGELASRARRWARAITDLTGGPASRVGVFAYRSETAYAGTLAALASGAAFVPLNPTFPTARTAAMIAQAELDAIIVDRTCAPQIEDVARQVPRCPPLIFPDFEGADCPSVDARAVDARVLRALPELSELPPTVTDDLAYLLFTSGSTGTPKGVPITHGNVLHFLDSVGARYGITHEDRLSQTFDQTFDLSVFDLFAAWGSGAGVCAMSPVDLLAPASVVNKLKITVWFSVPSVPAQMRKRGALNSGMMPTLRWSLFCGEPLPSASAAAWQAAAPNSIVENLYGPTELTIACFVHRWDSRSSPALCVNEIVPIGRPLAGLVALVVDEEGRAAAEGEAGELCVSGPQTAPGYWRDAERTAESFPHFEVGPYDRRRFYRTGDRVVRLDASEYAFIGRSDHQIKVLGHRVELGEVEAAFQRHPGVVQVAALPWPMNQGTASGLVAFVTGTDLDPEEAGTTSSQVLPPYAVPQAVYVRPNMPVNANGKIDRKALASLLEVGTPLAPIADGETAATT